MRKLHKTDEPGYHLREQLVAIQLPHADSTSPTRGLGQISTGCLLGEFIGQNHRNDKRSFHHVQQITVQYLSVWIDFDASMYEDYIHNNNAHSKQPIL